jgi:hypothetical protein
MSESAYKLVCSSIDIKDPTILKKNIEKEITVNKYLSEMNSITQTDKRFGIKKTTYHSQVLFKVNASSTNGSAGLVFPFWQYLDSTTTANNIDIGKVVLKIRHKTTANNSANTQLFRLIGTKQSGTDAVTAATTTEETDDTIMYTNGNTTVSGSTSAHTAGAGTANTKMGTAADLYQSPFYIAGEDASSASVDRTYEIDFNTVLKTSVTANKPIALGLRLNETPAAESIFLVESHVEVITPDYTSYLNTHTIT